MYLKGRQEYGDNICNRLSNYAITVWPPPFEYELTQSENLAIVVRV